MLMMKSFLVEYLLGYKLIEMNMIEKVNSLKRKLNKLRMNRRRRRRNRLQLRKARDQS